MKFVSGSLALALTASAALAAPTFTPIGMPGGEDLSRALAVSPDGTQVVGYAGNVWGYERTVISWTVKGGLVDIGGIVTGGSNAQARAVSNGGTLAGVAENSSATATYAFTSTGGSHTTFGSGSEANAISADGTVAAGISQSPGHNNAARYNANGTTNLLPALAAGAWSGAYDISADGTKIVGYSGNDSNNSKLRAVLWNGTNAPLDLGDLGSGWYSEARGISPDGNTVVGGSSYKPFVWTTESGMTELAVADGYYGNSANDVSDTGVAVGQASYTGEHGSSVYSAVIWTTSDGMIDLNVLLDDAGVLPAGWQLEEATGISADGTVIVGYASGMGPNSNYKQGFVVTLPAATPEPSTLALFGLAGLGLIKRRR